MGTPKATLAPVAAASELDTSLYSYLVGKRPLITEKGETLPKTIVLPSGHKGYPIGVDNGNFALKSVMMDAERNELVHHRIIAATGPVGKTRTKSSQTKYRIRDLDESPSTFSEPFLIGRDALNFSPADQLSLAVGSTAERLKNKRQLHFLLAGHVDTLCRAHYPAGTYPCILNYGFPNDEFVEGMLVDEAFDALGQIDGHTFEIERQAPGESPDKYILKGEFVIASPQTSGTFAALNFDLDGKLRPTTVKEVLIVDFGGGHTQSYRVKYVINNKDETELVAYGGKLGVGKGFITIARQFDERLRDRYPNVAFSDIHIQAALADGVIRLHGEDRRLEDLVEPALLDRLTETFLGDTLQVLQQESASVTFTGGGLSQERLWNQLQEQASSRKEGLRYLDRSLAAVLNAYGLYLLAVIQAISSQQEVR